MRVEYREVKLSDVLEDFAKGFTPRDPKVEVTQTESFVDHAKGVVVFKLYVDDKA